MYLLFVRDLSCYHGVGLGIDLGNFIRMSYHGGHLHHTFAFAEKANI